MLFFQLVSRHAPVVGKGRKRLAEQAEPARTFAHSRTFENQSVPRTKTLLRAGSLPYNHAKQKDTDIAVSLCFGGDEGTRKERSDAKASGKHTQHLVA